MSNSRREGNVGIGVLAVLILGALGASLSTLSKLRYDLGLRQSRDTEKSLVLKFGIETFLVAYRNEETKYYEALATALCETGRPFYSALSPGGSGCPGFSTRVFNGASPDSALMTYSSPAGCEISGTSSDCQRFPLPIVEIGFGAAHQKISGHSFRFFLVDVVSRAQIVEFRVEMQLPDGRISAERFAIRNSFRNSAHLESVGLVVQAKPDPFSLCPGLEWSAYQIPVGGQCRSFSQLGGGTGLAFYQDYYFGFRPAEGLVVSLDQLTTSSSYIVQESGDVPGLGRLFPRHSRLSLIDADDITVSSGQIFFVKGQANRVAIWGLDPIDINAMPVQVCRLGERGWGQSYVGLASLSSNDPLLEDPSQPFTGQKSATFYLKTWSGRLLTAIVTSTAPGVFKCFVAMDPNLQATEYLRTWGFDRAKSEKPYFIY